MLTSRIQAHGCQPVRFPRQTGFRRTISLFYNVDTKCENKRKPLAAKRTRNPCEAAGPACFDSVALVQEHGQRRIPPAARLPPGSCATGSGGAGDRGGPRGPCRERWCREKPRGLPGRAERARCVWNASLADEPIPFSEPVSAGVERPPYAPGTPGLSPPALRREGGTAVLVWEAGERG